MFLIRLLRSEVGATCKGSIGNGKESSILGCSGLLTSELISPEIVMSSIKRHLMSDHGQQSFFIKIIFD